MTKYLAFIPARGGSKGIPFKNIKDIAGKPLINYTVDAAVQTAEIERIIVSSDSDLIQNNIEKFYGAEPKVEFHRRSSENSSDTASTESAMLEYLDSDSSFENMLLIQATSPLLKASDLSSAIMKYEETQAGGLVSVVQQKRFYWEANTNDDFRPVNYNPNQRSRRQDFKGSFVENGAFYITSRQLLEESKCRISPPYQIFEMGEESYFEIDNPSDWVIMENLLLSRNRTELDTKKIKLVLTDVDGVLTDAGMIYDSNGVESKRFNTRDGKAFELLRARGILCGIITAEETSMVEWRFNKIKADYLFQGVSNKLKIVKDLLDNLGLSFENLAYIGDDINDIEVLSHAGISACPSDAEDKVKTIVKVKLTRKGGEGALRELVNLILSQ
jgi:N-acylneuraminate cytidylyltransferase